MTYDTITTIQAAMFAALGTATKLSRSGNSVVFAKPVMGRNDLSGEEAVALRQARESGLNLEAVTPGQISAWQEWYANMHEIRRTGPEARFLITRKFSLQVGAHTLVPANRASLIDGRGEIVASAVFPCREEWDAQAINRMGGKGATVAHVNYQTINRWIEKARQEWPEFAGTRVQDNNQE